MPYSHIATEERDFLQSAFALSIDKSIIARILGKHISTVYREVTRKTSTGYYIATEAHKWASTRRLKTKPQPKLGNAELLRDIKKRFKQDHSPEQIAGRLKLDYPGQKNRHASTEFIYQYL